MAKKKVTRKRRAPALKRRAPAQSSRERKQTRARPSSKKKAVKKHAKRILPHRPVRAVPRIPARRSARIRTQVSKSQRRVTAPKPRPPLQIDRNQRTALKGALYLIRKHVKGYAVSDGYSVSAVWRLSRSRQKAILDKAIKIRELLASPHDLVKVKNERDKKALRPFARKQLRRAKHYIVHKPDDRSRVSLNRGRVRITRRLGRVEIDTVYFMFPHAPTSEDDAVEMLEDMLPAMPKGHYIMQTGAHGDTGEPASRGQLIERLRRYINDYEPVQTTVYAVDEQGVERAVGNRTIHQGFTQAVMGFRFISTSLDGAVMERENIDARRQAAKEFNERLRKQHLTQAEKDEAKAEWNRKRARRKRKASARKAAKTRSLKKARAKK